MIDKQKAREQKVVINDVEKVHEICLEQKYLTEEELTASLKEPDTEVEDNNQSTVKCSVIQNSIFYILYSVSHVSGCKKFSCRQESINED